MISADEHLHRILGMVSPLETERVSVGEALGRVLREQIRSDVDLPPWPNSAMDGFAVRHEELLTASTKTPVTLPVVGDIPAGLTQAVELPPGSAMRIMTGAPIPDGCSAVVPIELTAEFDPAAHTSNAPLTASITFCAPINEGANIREKGEDISSGQALLSTGQMLSANRIGAAAAAGITEVTVTRQIRVAILSTGSELVSPGTPLAHGQIFDSNGPLLRALCSEAGAQVVAQMCVPDDVETLSSALTSLLDAADVIVLTGGASVGAHDTTRTVLDEQLAPQVPAAQALHRVRFEKVAMQPGKPQGFGVSDSGVLLFALPGNPVSVWVSFHLFLAPAFRALQAEVTDKPAWQLARVTRGWQAPSGREQFMPIRVASAETEPLSVEPASAKGSRSHLAATLASATGIARVPASIDTVQVNDMVPVLLTSTRG